MPLTDAPIAINPAEPVQFTEAIQWFAEQAPWISGSSWGYMERIAAQKGDQIAGATVLAVLDDVWKDLDRSVAEGLPYGDFLRNLADRMDQNWWDIDSHRMGLIYHNNVGNALMAGRFSQMEDPAVLEDRPYWMFDAISDFRTSERCSERDGVCLPASDPWWKTNRPLLHHGCRSSIIAVTYDEALEHGITQAAKLREFEDAQDGWGAPAAWLDWEPKREDYAAPLFDEYERWRTGQEYISDKAAWDARWQTAMQVALPPEATQQRELDVDQVAFDHVGKMSKPFLAKVQATGRIISAAHGVSRGDQMPAVEAGLKGMSEGTKAAYYPAMALIRARTNTKNDTPFHLIHEFGHHLDYRVMGDRSLRFGEVPGKSMVSASLYKTGPELARVMSLIMDSREVADIRAAGVVGTVVAGGKSYKIPKAYTRYLLLPHELWARAYAQFIVTEADRSKLSPEDLVYLEAADKSIAGRDGAILRDQWSPESFAPIADAIRNYFRSLGWMP